MRAIYLILFVHLSLCILLVLVFREQLENLRSVINSAKQANIDAARPQILAAEENLHSMIVDLDKVVTKVCAVIRLTNVFFCIILYTHAHLYINICITPVF